MLQLSWWDRFILFVHKYLHLELPGIDQAISVHYLIEQKRLAAERKRMMRGRKLRVNRRRFQ